MTWILVGAAGAAGTLLRHFFSLALPRFGGIPYATLVVNIVGSFAAGLVYHLAFHKFVLDESTRQVLAVGFLGGLTTFSAFSLETVQLWNEGRTAGAFIYVLVSVSFSIGAVMLAMRIG